MSAAAANDDNAATSYEQHVRQNNERLATIRQSLRDRSGFVTGCRELIEWCADVRAFQKAFEESLITTLAAVVSIVESEGYDRSLVSRLITCCHKHRKMLAKENAGRIDRWFEQFRESKSSKAAKAVVEPLSEAPMDGGALVADPATASGSMWQPPPGAASSGGPLMAEASMNGFHPSASYDYQMQPHQRYVAYPQQQQQQQPSQHHAVASPSYSYPVDPTGARSGYKNMQSSYDPSQRYGYPTGYPQPDAALMQHQQQQQLMMSQMQAQAGYPQQVYQGQMRMPTAGPSSPMYVDQTMYQNGPMQRNPGMPMQLRQPGPPMMMPAANSATYPMSHRMIQPGAAPRPPSYPPGTVPMYPQGGASQAQMMRAGGPMIYGYQAPFPQECAARPMLVDQTPRITMAELVLIPQFHLEHNVTTTNFPFNISQENYNELMQAPHLDVQLKCFHREDKRQYNTWPTMTPGQDQTSVTVVVNEQMVPIYTHNRSLFLKQFIKPGANTLQLTVSQCVCSHHFILQVVSRIPVRQIIDTIVHRTKKDKTIVNAKERVVALLQHAATATGSGHLTEHQLPLYSRKTGRRITIPARSGRCQHAACFDLEPLLACNQDNAYYDCPICGAIFMWNEIEFDMYIHQILAELAKNGMHTVTDVFVDGNGAWRYQNLVPAPIMKTEAPTRKSGVKRDSGDHTGGGQQLKRIKSEQFAMIKSEMPNSPLFNPNSVPAPGIAPWLQSPNGGPPSVLSPYGAPSSISPPHHINGLARCGPPSAPSKYGNPATPVTPGTAGQNPPSVGNGLCMSPGGTIGGTAHHQHQGAVDTSSVTGSAPYTPASVGSAGSHHHVFYNSSVGCVDAAHGQMMAMTQVTGVAEAINELDLIDDFGGAPLMTEGEMLQMLQDDPNLGTKRADAFSDVDGSLSSSQRDPPSDGPPALCETGDWPNEVLALVERR